MLRNMPQLGGVRLAPIPPELLPSVMEVSVPVEDDEHGGSRSDPVTVRGVRLVRASEVRAATSGGAQGGYLVADDVTGTVYVDAANSAGAFEVPVGSLVSVDGGEAMEAVRVQRLDHPDGTCHHWEVSVR